ncbi:MAG: alpha/beta hydrolase family protein, partial [Mycobacteriales bacterium]
MAALSSPRRLGLLAAGALLISTTLAGLSGPASADTCTTTPSTVVPGVSILDPACSFTPMDGSTVTTGILHGAAYRIEVPAHWNGSLVMFAHGYAGTGTVVSVSNPQLRRFWVDHGYAWAASSYRQNGYDVGDGVEDTHDLMTHFPGLAHQRAPRTTYMTGLSMGGAITAAELERYRGQYDGAMPYCGVLGGNSLFDYFLGANATAAALAHAPLQYPTTADAGAAYVPTFDATVKQQVMPALGITPTSATTFRTQPTAAGTQWIDAVEQLSGGTRPGFPGALQYYWDSFGFAPLTDVPFLFGLYPGLTGGTIGYADGNVASNTGTTYELDGQPGQTPAEQQLNADVIRVARTATVTTNVARTELP